MNDRIDLDAIRARLAAAGTPGPWKTGSAMDSDGWAVVAGVDGDDEVCAMPRSRLGDEFTDGDADLIAHAPADLAALCDEVERLRAELDEMWEITDARLVRALDREERLRAELSEALAAVSGFVENRAKLRAKLRAELDDARNVALGLTEDCAGLREIIAGRTTAPTGAEVAAHARARGWWLYQMEGGVHSTRTPSTTLWIASFGGALRWWALDASGAPCKWPVVTEVDRG